MSWKAFFKSLVPPAALDAASRIVPRRAAHLSYAPQGWDTPLPDGAVGYEAPSIIESEKADWIPMLRALQAGRLPLDPHDGPEFDPERATADHNGFMTFAYVLAVAARTGDRLRVLDYGGSLGQFHGMARAFLPEVALDYHCKELPGIARAGRDFSPEVTWHTSDACLDQDYELVVFSGSLQYLRDWRTVLARASRAATQLLYLTDVSAVEGTPGYCVLQRALGTAMLFEALNKAEVLALLENERRRLLREFWVRRHLRVEGNPPRQPFYYGGLFATSAWREGTARALDAR